MRQKAADYEQDVLNWFRSRGGDINYTQLYSERRYYFGSLGEYAFQQLLIDQHKDYRYQQVVGGADSGDFTLHWHNHCQRIADAKTATQVFHRNIMMPQSQVNRHKYHFYVGVKLCDSEAEVWGFTTLDQFQLKQDGFDHHRVPTLYRPLNQLTDIDELLDQVVEKIG